MDVFFFTLLLCLGEWLIVMGATRWFPKEAYTLSLTAAVSALVMIRWGSRALIPALAGGLVFCLASGASLQHYLIYGLGNAFILALLPLMKKPGWQKIRENALLTMTFGWLSCLAMDAGRMIISLIWGNGLRECLGFFTTDMLSWLFSALVLWICRQLDGILEDQKHYLIRIQKEKEENEGA